MPATSLGQRLQGAQAIDERLPAPEAHWERGYCGAGATLVFTDIRAPNRGACVLLCARDPTCRFVAYSGADGDCMGASVCPRPLSMVNHPSERHYTLELRDGAACQRAESEARAARTELAAAVARGVRASEAARWFELASPHTCDSLAASAVARMARNSPEAACERASHGVWTLTVAEASSWAVALRGCLRRCSRCARCRFVTVAPAHALCMWHHACAADARDAGEGGGSGGGSYGGGGGGSGGGRRRPRQPPPPPPPPLPPQGGTGHASPGAACGFRTGRVPAREQRARSLALVFFGKFGGAYGRSSHMAAGDNASTELIERAHASWNEHLLAANPDAHVDVFAHSWSGWWQMPSALTERSGLSTTLGHPSR